MASRLGVLLVGLLVALLLPVETSAETTVKKCVGFLAVFPEESKVWVHNDGDVGMSFKVRWLDKAGATVGNVPLNFLVPGHTLIVEGPLQDNPSQREIVAAKITSDERHILLDAENTQVLFPSPPSPTLVIRRQVACHDSVEAPDRLFIRQFK